MDRRADYLRSIARRIAACVKPLSTSLIGNKKNNRVPQPFRQTQQNQPSLKHK